LWIAPVRAARAELGWLSGDTALAAEEATSGYGHAAGCAEPWTFGSLVIWFSRLGMPVRADLPSGLPEPYAREMAGDWAGAARQLIRPAVIGFTLLCLADWVLVQDLGFFGGLGTDPNSMIPFVLLALAGYLALTRVPSAPLVPASPAPAAEPAPRWRCA
jgi:hypothetical protein